MDFAAALPCAAAPAAAATDHCIHEPPSQATRDPPQPVVGDALAQRNAIAAAGTFVDPYADFLSFVFVPRTLYDAMLWDNSWVAAPFCM